MSSKRLKGISISVPVLYGNTAVRLAPEKRTESTPVDHTHEWTVFFKPVVDNIDLTPLIKKVTFKLHETYNSPIRTVEEPPYQVTETGWGEFEITIKLHFVAGAEFGVNEKNFQIFHPLTLHPYNPQVELKDNGEVNSVKYDELVFQEPTEKLFEVLTQKPVNLIPFELSDSSKHDLEYTRKDELDELDRLGVYIGKIKLEIEKQLAEFQELELQKNALNE